MKTALITLVTAFAAFSLFSAETNLLKNPDFKAGIKAWNGITHNNGSGKVVLSHQTKDKKFYKCTIYQDIASIQHGTYVFSGYYKGTTDNFYIIFRAGNAQKKNKDLLSKWIEKKAYVKATDKPGWFKFSYTVNVPADTVRATVYFEAWGKKDQTVELTNISLVKPGK